jgi:hypothetical protein
MSSRPKVVEISYVIAKNGHVLGSLPVVRWRRRQEQRRHDRDARVAELLREAVRLVEEGLADRLRHFQMHDRRYSRRSASHSGSPAPPAIGRGVKHLT